MAAILAIGGIGITTAAAAAYPQTGYFDIGDDCFLDSSGKKTSASYFLAIAVVRHAKGLSLTLT